MMKKYKEEEEEEEEEEIALKKLKESPLAKFLTRPKEAKEEILEKVG